MGCPAVPADRKPCVEGFFEVRTTRPRVSATTRACRSAAVDSHDRRPGRVHSLDVASGGYNTISGTSMASPHVAGVVALCFGAGTCTGGGSPASIISAIDTTDPAKGFAGDPNHSPVSGRYYGYLAWFTGGSGPPPAPDFALAALPASQTVTQGGSTSYTVTITPSNGFNSPVSLSVSGLPAGASAGFNPNPAGSSSTLSLTTAASTPAGSYPLTITGASGSLTRTTPATLVVNAAHAVRLHTHGHTIEPLSDARSFDDVHDHHWGRERLQQFGHAERDGPSEENERLLQPEPRQSIGALDADSLDQ